MRPSAVNWPDATFTVPAVTDVPSPQSIVTVKSPPADRVVVGECDGHRNRDAVNAAGGTGSVSATACSLRVEDCRVVATPTPPADRS